MKWCWVRYGNWGDGADGLVGDAGGWLGTTCWVTSCVGFNGIEDVEADIVGGVGRVGCVGFDNTGGVGRYRVGADNAFVFGFEDEGCEPCE